MYESYKITMAEWTMCVSNILVYRHFFIQNGNTAPLFGCVKQKRHKTHVTQRQSIYGQQGVK